MADITFYDLELLNKPRLVWSPNTCKTRYALNLKGIPYRTEWVNFGSLKTIIPSITKRTERPTVPIITHGEKPIVDSYTIAEYLDETFPSHPSLFAGERGVHKFVHNYCDRNINLYVFKLVLLEIWNNIGNADDQAWFRKDREQGFGMTLEEFSGDASQNIAKLKEGLKSVSFHLKEFPFITGKQPGWADVVLLSHLTFLDALKPDIMKEHVLTDSNINAWWNRTSKYRTDVPSSANL